MSRVANHNVAQHLAAGADPHHVVLGRQPVLAQLPADVVIGDLLARAPDQGRSQGQQQHDQSCRQAPATAARPGHGD